MATSLLVILALAPGKRKSEVLVLCGGSMRVALEEIVGRYREVSDDTILYDGGDGIDSLSLVRLIVSLEERCDERFGKRLTLADEKAMSLRHSPYRTAGALTEFIVDRLQSDE